MAEVYYLAVFTEDSYDNQFQTEGYTFYLADVGNCIQLHRSYPSSGTDDVVFSFNYTDGYNIDQYSASDSDYDSADPDGSNWSFVTSYNDINDWNSNGAASLGSYNMKLNFQDVVDDPGEDYYTLYLYQNDLSTPITTYGSDEGISFYVSDHDIYDSNDTIVFSFTDGFYVEQYNDSTYYDSYTDTVNFNLSALSYEDVQLVFHDVVNPGPGPEPGPSVNKTHIGNSTVALKKVGNSTVVKEVLNGVVIYQA